MVKDDKVSGDGAGDAGAGGHDATQEQTLTEAASGKAEPIRTEAPNYLGQQAGPTLDPAPDVEQLALRHDQRLRAVGLLAAELTHQLNGLVQSILVDTEWALSRVEPESPVKDNLERIQRVSLELRWLTHSMMSFSRRDRGALELVNPSDLVFGMERLVASKLRADHINLEFNVMPLLPSVGCYRQAVLQVLVVLVLNARDALLDRVEVRGQPARVRIGADLRQRDGQWLRLTVEDNGPGIEPDLIELIFEPFFTTRSSTGNVGLGLHLASEIVAEHHGHLTVESQVGRWTRFYVDLPLANGD